MRNETLTLRQKQCDFDPEYDRLLQSISLTAPTQRIELDIDITDKATLPAIIETALLLVAQIEAVSETELGNFFGLNSHECDVLVSQLVDSGLVKYDDKGDLISTAKLRAQRRAGATDKGIEIEEVKNFQTYTYIDRVTGHIQPRNDKASAQSLYSLPMLDRSHNEKDYSLLISEQWARFKETLPDNHALKRPQTRLYRVNRATAMHSASPLAISINVHAVHDPLRGIRLDTRLVEDNDDNAILLQRSGLVGHAIEWLAHRGIDSPSSTLQDYCDIAQDSVIGRYIKNDLDGQYLDISRLLYDRTQKHTGYGNKHIEMLIGPSYAPGNNNRDKILHWMKRQPKNKRWHQAIWLGADNKLFGASLGFESFIKELNDELGQGNRNSAVNLLFKLELGNEGYTRNRNLLNTFKERVNKRLFSYRKGKQESHLEMMVLPGINGCAFIQYHVRLDPKLGLEGLTMPIGYWTTDPERVNTLWNTLRNRISSQVTDFNCDTPNETINKQLSCEPDALEKMLVDQVDKRMQELMDHFNNT